MTFFSMLVMMLLGGVVQAVLPTAPWLGEIRPPVLLCLTTYYALTRARPPLGAAVTAGLIQDALGPIPLGTSSFCFCCVALLIHRQRETVFAGQGVTHFLFGAAAAGLATAGLYALLAVNGAFSLPMSRVLLKILGAMALGGGVAPLVYGLMERLDRMLGNQGMQHG